MHPISKHAWIEEIRTKTKCVVFLYHKLSEKTSQPKTNLYITILKKNHTKPSDYLHHKRQFDTKFRIINWTTYAIHTLGDLCSSFHHQHLSSSASFLKPHHNHSLFSNEKFKHCLATTAVKFKQVSMSHSINWILLQKFYTTREANVPFQHWMKAKMVTFWKMQQRVSR